jgi:hypothetical protein
MKQQLLLCFLLLSIICPPASLLTLPTFAQQPAASQLNAKTLTLAGLRSNVTIRRDERGIPHIEAMNEADLYFAQGYATASDRLWQMDLLRRTARGELAEIFGRTVLEEDKRHRIYGFAALSGNPCGARFPADARRARSIRTRRQCLHRIARRQRGESSARGVSASSIQAAFVASGGLGRHRKNFRRNPLDHVADRHLTRHARRPRARTPRAIAARPFTARRDRRRQ